MHFDLMRGPKIMNIEVGADYWPSTGLPVSSDVNDIKGNS